MLMIMNMRYFIAFFTILFCLNGCSMKNSSMHSVDNCSLVTSFYIENGNKIEMYDKIVGTGSYSTIYLGRDEATYALLAIKVQPYKEISDINHEISQLKKVKFYYGEHIIKKDKEILHYLIMPYFQGKSIDELYQSNNAFSKKEVLEMFIASAEALQAIHKKNLVHNDIHEGNLIYNAETNKATWVDYAFAVELPSSKTYRKVTIKGKPPLYKAPESNQQRGYATDIYQLGFMFLRMLLVLTSNDSEYRHELIKSRDFSYKEIKKQPIDASTKIFHEMMSKNWQQRPSISAVIKACKSQKIKMVKTIERKNRFNENDYGAAYEKRS